MGKSMGGRRLPAIAPRRDADAHGVVPNDLRLHISDAGWEYSLFHAPSGELFGYVLGDACAFSVTEVWKSSRCPRCSVSGCPHTRVAVLGETWLNWSSSAWTVSGDNAAQRHVMRPDVRSPEEDPARVEAWSVRVHDGLAVVDQRLVLLAPEQDDAANVLKMERRARVSTRRPQTAQAGQPTGREFRCPQTLLGFRCLHEALAESVTVRFADSMNAHLTAGTAELRVGRREPHVEHPSVPGIQVTLDKAPYAKEHAWQLKYEVRNNQYGDRSFATAQLQLGFSRGYPAFEACSWCTKDTAGPAQGCPEAALADRLYPHANPE